MINRIYNPLARILYTDLDLKNIDAGGTQEPAPTPPQPITYLTQWQIVGNSEVHGNEIWSCGEYNPIDGKYHILVQPLGGSIADIALDAPLRKVNDVADTIEFPSDTEGKALVTRKLTSVDKGTLNYTPNPGIKRGVFTTSLNNCKYTYGLTADGEQEATITSGEQAQNLQDKDWCFLVRTSTSTYLIIIYYAEYAGYNAPKFAEAMSGKEFIYELAIPITELVDAPQIEEAESYTCVISQGGKAVEWSEFIYGINYLSEENRSQYALNGYYINAQSNKWGARAGDVSWMIPCTSGKKFKVKTNPTASNASYAFLKTNNAENNVEPDYATGYSVKVNLTKDTENILTAPSDATYLFLTGSSTTAGTDATPILVCDMQ